MSRWEEEFQKHDIKGKAERISDLLRSLRAFDTSNPSEIQEIARLKKVAKFIFKIFESENIEKDMIPFSSINNIANALAHAEKYINEYMNSRNANNLINANNQMDSVIALIKPYYPLSPGKARVAGKAFSEYAKTIKESIEEIKEKLEDINNFYEDIFRDKGVKDDILLFKDEIYNYHSDIRNLYDYIFSPEDELSREEEIKKYYKEITRSREDIKEMLQEASDKYKRIEQAYKGVFGYKRRTEDEGGEIREEYIEGIKDEFDKLLGRMEEFEQEHKDKYDAMIKKIKSLLPGATRAGLAAAFRANKDSQKWAILLNSGLFIISIILILLLSSSILIKNISISPLSVELYELSHNNIKVTIDRIFIRMSMVLPLIWLAMAASKRRNQAIRLQQEYAHKEAIASSYENFREQVEKLQKGNDDLLYKLMNSVIDQISKNPAITLEKIKHDNMPIADYIEEKSNRQKSEK